MSNYVTAFNQNPQVTVETYDDQVDANPVVTADTDPVVTTDIDPVMPTILKQLMLTQL